MSSTSTSVQLNETYVGYDELITYLKERKRKTFWGFLIKSRKTIVESSLSSPASCWQDLERTWISRFLEEAEKLGDQNLSKEMVYYFYFARKG